MLIHGPDRIILDFDAGLLHLGGIEVGIGGDEVVQLRGSVDHIVDLPVPEVQTVLVDLDVGGLDLERVVPGVVQAGLLLGRELAAGVERFELGDPLLVLLLGLEGDRSGMCVEGILDPEDGSGGEDQGEGEQEQGLRLLGSSRG